jgi:serine/threonine protein kinase
LNEADISYFNGLFFSTIKDMKKEYIIHHQLRHPNIVQLMAMICVPGKELGFVLFYEKYGSLWKFCRSFVVPWPWKIKLLYHVSLGVNYLHTHHREIIHGDLKSANVLVGDGFRGKVKQFELSKVRQFELLRSC